MLSQHGLKGTDHSLRIQLVTPVKRSVHKFLNVRSQIEIVYCNFFDARFRKIYDNILPRESQTSYSVMLTKTEIVQQGHYMFITHCRSAKSFVKKCGSSVEIGRASCRERL